MRTARVFDFPVFNPSAFDFERVFSEFFPGANSGRGCGPASAGPAINAWESADSIVIEAELPGYKMDDIDISLLGRELVIKGSRAATLPENAELRRAERSSGAFERTIKLGVNLDESAVSATLTDGVLTITLPKAAEVRARKINVKTS